MSMSERDLEVLERLERELMAPATPLRPVARWARVSAATPALLAAVGLATGLALVLLGLVLNNVAGIALAALAYPLIVGSAVVLYQRAHRIRAAVAHSALALRR